MNYLEFAFSFQWPTVTSISYLHPVLKVFPLQVSFVAKSSLFLWNNLLTSLFRNIDNYKLFFTKLPFSIVESEETKEDASVKPRGRMTIVNVVDTALNVFGIDTPTNIVKSDQELQETDSLESLSSSKNQQLEETTESTETIKLKNPLSHNENAPPCKLRKISLKPPKVNRKHRRIRRSSDPYFIALFWLFVSSRFWLHAWLLQFLPILFFIYVLKSLFIKLALYDRLVWKTKSFRDAVKSFFSNRKEILVPGPVKESISIIRTGDQKVLKGNGTKISTF